MGTLDEARTAWHEHIDSLSNEWTAKCRHHLSLPEGPEREAAEKDSNETYDRLFRAILGEGLVIPKGYHAVPGTGLPGSLRFATSEE